MKLSQHLLANMTHLFHFFLIQPLTVFQSSFFVVVYFSNCIFDLCYPPCCGCRLKLTIIVSFFPLSRGNLNTVIIQVTFMTGRKGLCGVLEGRIALFKARPVPLSRWCMHNFGNRHWPVDGEAPLGFKLCLQLLLIVRWVPEIHIVSHDKCRHCW